jgi:hypothetical protein
MQIVKLIKLVASLVLDPCIFLPLSQCSGPLPESHKGPAPLINSYIYGEVFDAADIEGIFKIFMWLLPAILAFISLKFGISIKLSLAQLISSVFAGLALWWTIIFSHKILWAAYLAGLSITVLLFLTLAELWFSIQRWRLRKH